VTLTTPIVLPEILFYAEVSIYSHYEDMKSGASVQIEVVQDFVHWTVAPPGFCNRGEVRYGSIGGLEYEVPQSQLYCLCINVALCSTALQCICRVIRRSSMTMKAHTLHNFWTSTHRGELSPPPGGATGIGYASLDNLMLIV